MHAGAVVTAVLVVSCPCALGLAFPLADEMATVALRKRGLFVRAGDLWGRLSHVNKLVFDKTGTLTLENPVLGEPSTRKALSVEARAVLHTLVLDNLHPVNRALLEALVTEPELPAPIAGEIVETVGQGVALGGWPLGRAGWSDGGEADGATMLARDGATVGRFEFRDEARRDARREITVLRGRGLDTFILSGDETGKVVAMARDLGLPPDNGYGNQTPQAKAAWLLENGADDACWGTGRTTVWRLMRRGVGARQ